MDEIRIYNGILCIINYIRVEHSTTAHRKIKKKKNNNELHVLLVKRVQTANIIGNCIILNTLKYITYTR